MSLFVHSVAMPRCVHCNHEFAVSEGLNCPACKQDFRGPRRADSKSKPAHLAVLEGASPQGNVGSDIESARPPKSRLVSTAGPAVPVLQQQNDSVPNSWMARLEAARMMASTDSKEGRPTKAGPQGGLSQVSSPTPSRPPPLKNAARSNKPKPAMVNKPAHLLVAQLQEEEARKQKEETQRLGELFKEEKPSDQSVANVEIDLPKEPKKKRRVPEWVIIALCVLGGGGLIAGVVSAVKKEPPPTATVDPALKAKAEKRKLAVAALEEGHSFALKGKDGADQAIKAYKRALELDGKLAGAERGLAIAYAAKDDKAKALEHYKLYLKLKPDAKDAKEVQKIIRTYEKKLGKKP